MNEVLHIKIFHVIMTHHLVFIKNDVAKPSQNAMVRCLHNSPTSKESEFYVRKSQPSYLSSLNT